MAERFKITNTTVKPPRVTKDGKDLRTIGEKVGHFLDFKDERGQSRLLAPNKFAVIGYIDEWFIEMEGAGELKIEEITDMGSALEEFRHHAAEAAKNATATETPKAAKSRVRAAEMGKSEINDTAVNPDGPPNYEVIAKRNGGLKETNAPTQ